MSTKRGLAVTVVLLLLQASITGCNYEPVPEPAAERNKTPAERYRLTIDFPNEIGSLPIKRARANYSIENRTCVPADHTMALGGRRPHFTKRILIDFRRTGNARYSGYLYADAFVSSDYYGLGVCKWTLESVDMLLAIRHDVSLSVGGRRILEGPGTQSRVCPKNGHPDLAIWSCLARTALAPGEEPEYFEVTVRWERGR